MIKIENVSKVYAQKGKRIPYWNTSRLTFPTGKSTLIKCICGVIQPTTGRVLIDERDSFAQRKKVIGNMGVVFNQKPSFIVDLSVNDNLEYFKAIYQIPKDQYH